MNILMYWEQESWGGVDTHLLTLLKFWPEKSDKIILVVNTENNGFKRIKAELEDIKYVVCLEVRSISQNQLINRCRNNFILKFFYPILHFIQPITFILCVKKFKNFIKKSIIKKYGPIDLYVGNNGSYPGAWGTLCFAESAVSLGIKGTMLIVHHAATKPLPFMDWFEKIIDRRLSKSLLAIISVSKATRETLINFRFLKPELINLPVIHNQTYENNPNIKDNLCVRELISAQDNEKIVGIVGRVSSYKGHADLLFGLARTGNQIKNKIRIVIIGDGPKEEISRLESISKNLNIFEQVHFLGFVAGDPSKLIKQFDLLAMVTRTFEGFGLTTLEAISVGTPVLATKVGAIEEYLNEEIATLINPSSTKEISKVFIELVSNPNVFLKKASVAKKRLKNDPVKMAEEYRHIFLEALEGRSL